MININFYRTLIEDKTFLDSFCQYLIDECNQSSSRWYYVSFSYSAPKNLHTNKNQGLTIYGIDKDSRRYTLLSLFNQGDLVMSNPTYLYRHNIQDVIKIFTRDILINHFL
jgi:hypothetical protein